MFLQPVDSIETSRGSLFDCKFCSILHMYGKAYREFSPQRVIQDIENAKSEGTKILMVTDDNFTLYPKRVKKLCQAIIDAGHNDISTIPETIGDLKDLQFLYISNNSLRALPQSMQSLNRSI